MRYSARYVLLTVLLVFALGSDAQFQKQSPRAALESAARESRGAAVDSTPKPENVEAEKKLGGVDVLTPTQGFAIMPYLEAIMPNVRRNWIRFIPSSAKGPQRKSPWSRKTKLKQGTVTVEFSIQRDGSLGFAQITESSGDEELDSAALYGVTESAPFPRLPEKFKPETLRVKFHFYCNPAHPSRREDG